MPMKQAKKFLLNLLTNLNENINKKFSFVKKRKKGKIYLLCVKYAFRYGGVSRKSIICISMFFIQANYWNLLHTQSPVLIDASTPPTEHQFDDNLKTN